jgi:glycosyltransferase involved in cell wall biosynthesis/protein-tyrosine-phosphatase
MTSARNGQPSTEPSQDDSRLPAIPVRPIRLLYLRGTLFVCGPAKTILNTWRVIDTRRFHVTIAATRPRRGERNTFLDAARLLGAPARELAIGRGVDLMAVWRLVRMIRTEQIDILQTHDSETRRIGILAAALAGVPHVSSVHGYICNDRKERVSRWLDHRLLRVVGAVITVSDRLRQDLVSAGVRQDRITLLQNAVVLADYPDPGRGVALRVELRIPEDALVVSIIGRLSAEKGHEDFLAAARIVLEALPRTRFLIAGDGPLRGLLEQRINELHLHGHVILTGHRSDLAELYGLTDVLAISSYTEGIPNVLLEAFAYGKPAVATAVGGVPEVLEHERTGYLVPPGDPAQMAARLIMLLESRERRQRMGRAGRQAVEERFSFVERTRTLERLYEKKIMPSAGLSFTTRPARTSYVARHAAKLRRIAGRLVRIMHRTSERLRHEQHHRRAIDRLSALQPRSVLMVCFGNICRSPYAALALAKALDNRGIRIDSAGFFGPGRVSPEHAQAAAGAHGIDLGPHRSKLLTAELLRDHDLIVVMEPEQSQTLVRTHRLPPARILVLGDLDPRPIETRTIIDPYGGSQDVFDECYRRIDRCVTALAGVIARDAGNRPALNVPSTTG